MTATGNSSPPKTDPLVGRVLAERFQLEARLGEGAMGAVYRARHVKVGRLFAVKVLHEIAADAKSRRRFEREAQLAGLLHHPNVIGIVDVGETEDGLHFMVMDYVEGPTLGALIDGPMPAARVIALVKQLCDGLQHAHDQGLIHRDLKPDNVIVERDRLGAERPRIVDFGIAIADEDARSPGHPERLTTEGLVLGTPHYLAPEQALAGKLDHRVDLFALGVICYELLTGELPFKGDGVEVARANLTMPTPPMGIRVPRSDVDPLLEAFTRRLMAKRPGERPPTAKAAGELLALIERDRPAAAAALGVSLPAPGEPPPRDVTRESAPVVRIDPADLDDDPVPPAHAAHHARGADAAGVTTARTSGTTARARRGWVIAAAAGGALALGGLAIAMRTSARGAPAPPADAMRATTRGNVTPPADAAPATPPPADASVLPIDAAPPADAAPRTDAAPPTDARPHVPPHRPPPRDPADPLAPVDATSPAAVARLYAQVGRELHALDTRRGSAATAELWPRYLRIKINDAIGDPAQRTATAAQLAALHRAIAAQR